MGLPIATVHVGCYFIIADNGMVSDWPLYSIVSNEHGQTFASLVIDSIDTVVNT